MTLLDILLIAGIIAAGSARVVTATPQEPHMVEPTPSKERYCTANRTHPTRRIISADKLGHVEQAHCTSVTRNWCVPCFVSRANHAPAS